MLQKRKPKLNSFTNKNKLLHSKTSKSTYFYSNDGDSSSSKSSSHIFPNRFKVGLSSSRLGSIFTESARAISRLRRSLPATLKKESRLSFCSLSSVVRTRPSLTNKNLYRKNGDWRTSYILPAFCSIALLLVLGIAINPGICSVTQSFALEGGEVKESDTNVSGDEVVESGGDTVDSNSISENVVSADNAGSNARTTTSIAINWDVRDPEEQETHGSSGEVLYRYNRFTLSANKIKQYQILVNAATGSSNNLVGYLDAEHTTPLNAEISGISDTNGATGSNIPENQWGYALVKGDVTTEGGLANLNYKAVPSASDSTIALTGTEETLDNQEFTVAFGANVGADKPAGHYTAYVTVSAVMEPKAMTWADYGLTEMQKMTSSICNAADEGTTGQLKDTRDGKTYWVTKLKDQNCWMTQNLDLDLNSSKALTSSDSDVINPWGPPNSTQMAVSPKFTEEMNEVQSWDPAEGGVPTYCMVYGTITISCYPTSTTPSGDGHYAQGNYYSWGAATAQSGESLSNSYSNSKQSICPKNWMLPIGKTVVDKSFGLLFSKYSASDSGFIIEPLYFTPTGRVAGASLSDVSFPNGGYYWTSTPYDAGSAYAASMNSYSSSYSYSINRYWGFSVRCVAR